MVDPRTLSFPLFVVAALATQACAEAPVVKARTDYGERQARVAERALEDAEQQMDALEVEAAEYALVTAREALLDPDVDYYPERTVLRSRLSKDEARLVRTQETKDRLAREVVMNRQQERVADSMEKLDEAMVALGGLQITREDLVAAKEAFYKTRQVLAKGKPFEPQFATYAKYALECESTLSRKKNDINLAEGVVAFVNGPAVRQEKAKELINDAGAATSTTRPTLYRQALANLEQCKLSGQEMLAAVENLKSAKVWVGGETTTPKAITDFCESRAVTMQKRIAEATQEAQKAQARRIPPSPATSSKTPVSKPGAKAATQKP